MKPPQQSREVHYYLYKAAISNPDFEVYEGVGTEVYTVREALKRDDLSPSTRYTLTNLLGG